MEVQPPFCILQYPKSLAEVSSERKGVRFIIIKKEPPFFEWWLTSRDEVGRQKKGTGHCKSNMADVWESRSPEHVWVRRSTRRHGKLLDRGTSFFLVTKKR